MRVRYDADIEANACRALPAMDALTDYLALIKAVDHPFDPGAMCELIQITMQPMRDLCEMLALERTAEANENKRSKPQLIFTTIDPDGAA